MKICASIAAALACLGHVVQVQAIDFAATDVQVGLVEPVLSPVPPQAAAALSSRQMTRERVVAREIGARLTQHRRAKRSSIPVLPTICGTLPGQNYIIRATTSDTGPFPSSQPAYLSSRVKGQLTSNIYFVGMTTDMSVADVYKLDETSACELTGISRAGTTVRGRVDIARQQGSLTTQATPQDYSTFDPFSGDDPLVNFSCNAVNNVITCTFQGSTSPTIFYEYFEGNTNGFSSARLGACEPSAANPNPCAGRVLATLTLVPV